MRACFTLCLCQHSCSTRNKRIIPTVIIIHNSLPSKTSERAAGCDEPTRKHHISCEDPTPKNCNLHVITVAVSAHVTHHHVITAHQLEADLSNGEGGTPARTTLSVYYFMATYSYFNHSDKNENKNTQADTQLC